MNWVNPVSDDVEAARAKAAAFDTTVPHVARIYDFLLGGKDNYQADRDAAERLIAELPHCADAARENRSFLGRAVRHLAGRGIRQFLDIGSGFPAAGNVHQVAQRADPACRVVYVDNDAVVLAHARANLAEDGVSVAEGHPRPGGDLRRRQGSAPTSASLSPFSCSRCCTSSPVPTTRMGSSRPHRFPGTWQRRSHLAYHGRRHGRGELEPCRAAGLPGRVGPGGTPQARRRRAVLHRAPPCRRASLTSGRGSAGTRTSPRAACLVRRCRDGGRRETAACRCLGGRQPGTHHVRSPRFGHPRQPAGGRDLYVVRPLAFGGMPINKGCWWWVSTRGADIERVTCRLG